MNKEAILMCLNIPRGITDENLHELFSAAGPVNDIYCSPGGKSVFIIYEHEEAIATAKEIFKDVKLYGRPIRMYGQTDIDAIYSKRTDRMDLKRKHESEIGPPAKRRYEESYHQRNFYGEYNQSPDPYRSQRTLQTSPNHGDIPPSTPERMPEDRFKPSTFHRRENPYLSASRNSYRDRSDLMPSTKKTYQTRADTPPSRNTYERGCATPSKFDSRDDYERYDSSFRNDYKRSEDYDRDNRRSDSRRDFIMENPYSKPPLARYERRDESPQWNDHSNDSLHHRDYQRNRRFEERDNSFRDHLSGSKKQFRYQRHSYSPQTKRHH